MTTLHTTRTGLRTTLLVAAAPFIGLAFILTLPVAGLVALAWFAARALARQTRLLTTIRDVALFAAAPFIGLVYVLAMPAVGLFMLARIAAKELTHHAAPAAPAMARQAA